ncbi:MAG: alpha/beta fold hydrolase [Erysipelotrichaceae bacterium]|nr:alpha/beta fold hydrolase [Erysipelotrichaceae bacterium]
MIFFKKKVKKPTIVAIHGFGLRQEQEFYNLKIALEEKGYQFKTIRLYNLEDENDTDWTSWVAKARLLITQASFENDVILVGFSMGGVIASYLANEYRVKKLILLAPAFEYLNLTTLIDHIPNPFAKNEVKSQIPTNFTNTFIELVYNCKNSINDIKIPTLIIHCEDDNVIPLSSSNKNIKKIPIDSKALITISRGQHRILDDNIAGPIAINNIISFIEDKFLK